MNMIHALTGRGVTNAMRHTCITSVVFNEDTGEYIIEREQLLSNLPPIDKHFKSYNILSNNNEINTIYSTKTKEFVGEEIFCSLKHLPDQLK